MAAAVASSPAADMSNADVLDGDNVIFVCLIAVGVAVLAMGVVFVLCRIFCHDSCSRCCCCCSSSSSVKPDVEQAKADTNNANANAMAKNLAGAAAARKTRRESDFSVNDADYEGDEILYRVDRDDSPRRWSLLSMADGDTHENPGTSKKERF